MSFILDALKKADEARHPTAPPSLGKIRIPRLAPRQARWPWVLGGAVVLALNAGVITYVLWPRAVSVMVPALDARTHASARAAPVVSARSPEVDFAARPQGPMAPAPPAPRVASAKPSEVRTTTIAPAPPVPPVNPPSQQTPGLPASPTSRPVAPTTVSPTPPPAPPSSPPTGPATVSPVPPPAALASPRPALAEQPRPAATTPGPATPAGPGGGAAEISKLRLTVHVWADKPAERLVFINGRKYVQGDRIDDKVLLEEITHEGAMVSYQGLRSLLRP